MAAVKIIRLTEEQILNQRIRQWPVWEKDISRFPSLYEETEQCLFIEGEVIIETGDKKYVIKPGDFVTFEEGLNCIWDIRKKVKKYYNFL